MAGIALSVRVRAEKEAHVVNVVENQKPFPALTIIQPVMHELEYVCVQIPPSKDLDLVCNVPIALLKPGRVARMHPEHPRFGGSLSNSEGVFDSKL